MNFTHAKSTRTFSATFSAAVGATFSSNASTLRTTFSCKPSTVVSGTSAAAFHCTAFTTIPSSCFITSSVSILTFISTSSLHDTCTTVFPFFLSPMIICVVVELLRCRQLIQRVRRHHSWSLLPVRLCQLFYMWISAFGKFMHRAVRPGTSEVKDDRIGSFPHQEEEHEVRIFMNE
ncbi:hypothetical protein K461DRAFT_67635 [Myriangium duriaei CBS 260.36]|uniref:Uncharacterized protein n=1 Tax=Myriangium duriaei CBS 260.36 TaxID=1168546 RepID=A0A9P4IWH0_9PEZI|nr:hypothetical protein K461DRAFT_67635 [Myriangium duriaei CBS 260.36]